jgi:hypothetical protein
MSDDSHVDHVLIVIARSYYANYTITMVVIGTSISISHGTGTIVAITPGINLFMALYGLSVFLETPEPQRKGRKKYIAASFVITAVFAFSGSLDMANYFQILFRSTSPGHWRDLMAIYYKSWEYASSSIAFGLLFTIGDVPLVRCASCHVALLTDCLWQVYRCYIIYVEYWWVTILPTIMSLSALGLYRVRFRARLKLITPSKITTDRSLDGGDIPSRCPYELPRKHSLHASDCVN